MENAIEWIKSEEGEYKTADGKYTAVKGFNRAFGSASWNLYGGPVVRVFPTLRALKAAVEQAKCN